VFIADSCIGGLSVIKSLWDSGMSRNAVFLADYAINPLGIKTDTAIASVVDSWLTRAASVSDTLVMACNTLSIRYRQVHQSSVSQAGLARIVSMVDCFEAMVEAEACRLANKSILVIGTEFTAGQGLYSEVLNRAIPGIRVNTVAATELERKIARFERWDGQRDSSFTADLRQAIDNTDIAVMACTCFPMVKADLQALFPDVTFLDPGAYCSSLLTESSQTQDRKLTVTVTGDEVPETRVIDYARSYLKDGSVDSYRSQ
jgi:glutamate racemase